MSDILAKTATPVLTVCELREWYLSYHNNNLSTAAFRNGKMLLSDHQYVGLWHTRLQEANVIQQPYTAASAAQGRAPGQLLRIRVGDDGFDSFSTDMEFPWVPGCVSSVSLLPICFFVMISKSKWGNTGSCDHWWQSRILTLSPVNLSPTKINRGAGLVTTYSGWRRRYFVES